MNNATATAAATATVMMNYGKGEEQGEGSRKYVSCPVKRQGRRLTGSEDVCWLNIVTSIHVIGRGRVPGNDGLVVSV